MTDESENKTDLQRLVSVIRTYMDYENSLMLTPDAVRNIIEASEFDHENYTHRRKIQRKKKNNNA